MILRVPTFAAVVLLVPAFLAACGSSDEGSDGSSNTTAGGTGAVASGGASAGGTTSGGAAGGGAATGGVASGGATASGAASNATGGAETGGTASGGGDAVGGDAGVGGSITGGNGSGGDPGLPDADWPQINGVQWADTEGNPIQAHGGGIVKVGEDYYWFGENRNPNSTFYAVSAYRSRDLKQWEFRNHVLRMTSDPGLNPANVERPKVVYNASTKKYVMWMHWENGQHYGEARAAVASSDTVDGNYTYHGSFRPYADRGVTDHDRPGYMSRDCTLFVDDDGQGYFISATNENYDLNLYRLTPDYLEVDELVATLFPGGHREAPALFKRNGVYFLLTSGATGWDPNQAKYATSTSLGSGWSAMKNVADGTTYHSQSTYVVEVAGGGSSSFLYLGDRWAGAYDGRVNDSTYVWQPISFPANDQMSMSWNNTLDLDARQGRVQASTERFIFINEKSGLALDVEGQSTANGGDIVQVAPSGGASQSWSLNYNNAGHFRLTNTGSGKVLDVPDESTADGVELAQWDDNGGDHQAFLLIDLGQGRYRIQNKKSQKFIGIVGASTSTGAAVEQRASTGGTEQIWKVVVAE